MEKFQIEKPQKTTSRARGAINGLNETARVLRHNLTPAEEVLWQALRGRKLNDLKFRRQYPVGKFILDFYCAEQHLAVEVDGEIHDEQVERDAERTRMLNEFGVRVIRFSNQEVMTDLRRVLKAIGEAALTPNPSPNDRRGEVIALSGPSIPDANSRASSPLPPLGEGPGVRAND